MSFRYAFSRVSGYFNAARRVQARLISSSSYHFHVAASWAAKPPYPATRRMRPFKPNPAIVSWRDKTLTKLGSPQASPGEDFLFTRTQGQRLVFGVADGVGGWQDQGVDPSLFSQALMYYADMHSVNASPSECMKLAYDSVLKDDEVSVGSSTACILSLDASSGSLTTANLGDSGFCIYRNSTIFYASRPQTHHFNCPRQLSKLKDRSWDFSSDRAIVDHPRAASLHDEALADGDIVIAYTDGVSDNVWPAEIAQICGLALDRQDSEDTKAQLIASSVVYNARKFMFNQNRVSPFEAEARQHHKRMPGGKVDECVEYIVLCVYQLFPVPQLLLLLSRKQSLDAGFIHLVGPLLVHGSPFNETLDHPRGCQRILLQGDIIVSVNEQVWLNKDFSREFLLKYQVAHF
ncbi:Protein phosphatase [Mycena indigotica]|uniref:Protein phosphatase n=1 Tax=Mycena indigotica TaxID=2126181 RepID=A0A8H6S9S5_9AGAR|nr:Protein phosphatase [Mycena indigotica]KAF7294938.1 Protein phosphatase [Mycena indigotica]